MFIWTSDDFGGKGARLKVFLNGKSIFKDAAGSPLDPSLRDLRIKRHQYLNLYVQYFIFHKMDWNYWKMTSKGGVKGITTCHMITGRVMQDPGGG